MAKKSTKDPARERSDKGYREIRRVARKFSDAIASILESRLEWHKLTGGKAEKEFDMVSGVADEHLLPDGIASAAPFFIRLEAIHTWHEISNSLMGWAFEADLALRQIICNNLRSSPDYVEPENSDRRELWFQMRRQAGKPASPYTILVLPTDLVQQATKALMKLDYGEVDPIFSPSHRKSYKDGLTIPSLREDLLACYYYLHGAGAKKSEARRKVAEAALVSPEAVRNWERALERGYHGALSRFSSAIVHGAVDARKSFDEAQRLADGCLVPDLDFRSSWSAWERDQLEGRRGGYSHLYDLKKFSAQYRAALADQVGQNIRKSNG